MGMTRDRWDFLVVGRPFIFMMWETFVYFGLALLIEFFQLNSDALPWKRPPQVAYQQFEDDDSYVIDERRRIESLPLRLSSDLSSWLSSHAAFICFCGFAHSN